jgi:hypothetical protein
MKTIKLTLLTSLSLILLFGACKRSDNDPFLPFTSRDTRIAKTWKLASIEKHVETDSIIAGEYDYVTRVEYTYDGENLTVQTKYVNDTETVEYPYTRRLTIDKEGTYTNQIVKDENNDNEYEEILINGYWYWLNSNRKKIGIGFSQGEEYMIERLANDELVLKLYRYERYPEQGNIVSKTIDMVITFEKD